VYCKQKFYVDLIVVAPCIECYALSVDSTCSIVQSVYRIGFEWGTGNIFPSYSLAIKAATYAAFNRLHLFYCTTTTITRTILLV
jgi:hypothetical protein